MIAFLRGLFYCNGGTPSPGSNTLAFPPPTTQTAFFGGGGVDCNGIDKSSDLTDLVRTGQ